MAGWRAAYVGLVDADVLAALEVTGERVAALEQAFAHPAPDQVDLVAEQDGEVVGMARLSGGRDDDTPPAEVTELCALYVAPAHWAAGLGGRLLDEGFARTPQPVQVLWTLSGNARARGFYERRGFALDGAHRGRGLGPGATEVRYRRTRPPATG